MTAQCRSLSVANYTHLFYDAIGHMCKLAAKCWHTVQNQFSTEHNWQGTSLPGDQIIESKTNYWLQSASHLFIHSSHWQVSCQTASVHVAAALQKHDCRYVSDFTVTSSCLLTVIHSQCSQLPGETCQRNDNVPSGTIFATLLVHSQYCNHASDCNLTWSTIISNK